MGRDFEHSTLKNHDRREPWCCPEQLQGKNANRCSVQSNTPGSSKANQICLSYDVTTMTPQSRNPQFTTRNSQIACRMAGRKPTPWVNQRTEKSRLCRSCHFSRMLSKLRSYVRPFPRTANETS